MCEISVVEKIEASKKRTTTMAEASDTDSSGSSTTSGSQQSELLELLCPLGEGGGVILRDNHKAMGIIGSRILVGVQLPQ